MDKELEELRKMKLTKTVVFDEGYESPYTDVIRVYGGVLYRTMNKDKTSVHTVFVPFNEN